MSPEWVQEVETIMAERHRARVSAAIERWRKQERSTTIGISLPAVDDELVCLAREEMKAPWGPNYGEVVQYLYRYAVVSEHELFGRHPESGWVDEWASRYHWTQNQQRRLRKRLLYDASVRINKTSQNYYWLRVVALLLPPRPPASSRRAEKLRREQCFARKLQRAEREGWWLAKRSLMGLRNWLKNHAPS